MLIKKNQAKEINNTKDCTVYEYELPCELFSFALAEINGRYPDKGKVVNLDCEEIYYVTSGSGVVHSESGDFNIEQGDLYFFKKGEKYWVEGEKLVLILTNAPKWTSLQHKNID
jgi:mannose-6-phosphate isomerase-like protein (cupin superfamily)